MPFKTNPTTGRKVYTLFNSATNEVVKRNAVYPASQDDAPLDGFDPSLKYLAVDEDVPPEFDPRLFLLQKTETPMDDRWKVQYTPVKRSKAERKAHAFNRESVELQKHVDSAELPKLLFLVVYAIARKQKNQNWTAKEQALMDRLSLIGAALWKNLERRAEVEAAIDADEDPDLDAGWEAPPSISNG